MSAKLLNALMCNFQELVKIRVRYFYSHILNEMLVLNKCAYLKDNEGGNSPTY